MGIDQKAKTGRRTAGQRREEIIAAALTLFTRYGVHNVTTRQIARAVGISQPSLYAHFASSAEIAEEICVRGFSDLSRQLAAAFAGAHSRRDRLKQAARAYIGFGIDNPDVYRIAFMLEKPWDDTGHEGGRVMEAGLCAFNLMAETVTQEMGDGGRLAAQSIWATLHGLVALLIARPHFPWVDRDALIAAQVERAVQGF
ncbi:AcrR family transcriptional regulator [Sphingomonas zeicaulis]|uniref:TetR/AcrR family transcriptional regulator n=1 Tax=Sphingomonas zeicaulis TaxID=1632740 RepID=UPI003D24F8AC